MEGLLLIQKAVLRAEFTSVPRQWPAEELYPEFMAHCLALGHPLHHAEVGTTRLLRAASWAVRSARNPLFCAFRKVWGKEQLIINYSLKTTLKAPSTLDFITLLQTFSTINLLWSQRALGFASLLHLAGSNQLCAVLMTFNC